MSAPHHHRRPISGPSALAHHLNANSPKDCCGESEWSTFDAEFQSRLPLHQGAIKAVVYVYLASFFYYVMTCHGLPELNDKVNYYLTDRNQLHVYIRSILLCLYRMRDEQGRNGLIGRTGPFCPFLHFLFKAYWVTR